jgi:hypothetical protein
MSSKKYNLTKEQQGFIDGLSNKEPVLWPFYFSGLNSFMNISKDCNLVGSKKLNMKFNKFTKLPKD